MPDKTRAQLHQELAAALTERDTARTLLLPLETRPGLRRSTVTTTTTTRQDINVGDHTSTLIAAVIGAAIGIVLGLILAVIL